MSSLWESDQELFTLARRELFVAVVGDVMDNLGLRRQFLPPRIQAARQEMVLVGRAMPVLEADVFDEHGSAHGLLSGHAFGLMFDALDSLGRDEVYICTGASPTYALWGELMTLRARTLGAAGAVLDGYLRDIRGILEQDFPVFSYGSYAQDQGPRGKVIDYRIPIEIGGVRIEPGDVVFGDCDGVCVVPRRAEEDVFRAALEKARGEKRVREALERGMSAREAFETFGIL